MRRKLIYADEAIDKLKEYTRMLDLEDFQDAIEYTARKLDMELIDRCQEVNARSVGHAHWIDDGDGWYTCSECRSPQRDTTAFCSWCGADMLGEH